MPVVGKKNVWRNGWNPAEKNKSRSFRDAKSLGLINKERINFQEQSLRQPEREIKKGRRNEK